MKLTLAVALLSVSSVALADGIVPGTGNDVCIDPDTGRRGQCNIMDSDAFRVNIPYRDSLEVSPGATGAFAMIAGHRAAATHDYSTAIGYASTTDRENSVSFGNASQQRQLTFVAAGTNATDAVNLGQLDAAINNVNIQIGDINKRIDGIGAGGGVGAPATGDTSVASYTDARVTELNQQLSQKISDANSRIDDLAASTSRRFEQQDRRINRQSAMNAAMMNSAITASRVQGQRGSLGVGIGHSSGEQALSLGYAKQLTARTILSLGGAWSSDESTVGAGFGVGL